jgi:curved DNA-binding protein CbpA
MRRFTDVDYYAVLDVRSSATRDEIRTSYRLKVRDAHPDHGGDQEHFALISEAWEVLGNASEREYYDADRRLKARASRRYTARIDRDPMTGSWSTEGVVREAEPEAEPEPEPEPEPVRPDDGLTDAQRWMRDKRRIR